MFLVAQNAAIRISRKPISKSLKQEWFPPKNQSSL